MMRIQRYRQLALEKNSGRYSASELDGMEDEIMHKVELISGERFLIGAARW